MAVEHRSNNKLSLKYFGSFPTISRIGSVAYNVQLPPTTKIHPVFHVSQLKKFKGIVSDSYYPLLEVTIDMGHILQLEQVLQTQTILKGQLYVPQILIKWQDLDTSLTTWEDKTIM